MYTYRCPYCGARNYTELLRTHTDEYMKYRTDVCATATCHKSIEHVNPFDPISTRESDPLEYLVITSMDICHICPGRLECLIHPVVIAEVVPKEKAQLRHKRWRETIRDEQRLRTKG